MSENNKEKRHEEREKKRARHKERKKKDDFEELIELAKQGLLKDEPVTQRLEHDTFPVDLKFRTGLLTPDFSPTLLKVPSLLPYVTEHRRCSLDWPHGAFLHPEPMLGLKIDVANEEPPVAKPWAPEDLEVLEMAREVIGDDVDLIIEKGIDAHRIFLEREKKKPASEEARLREHAAQGAVWLKNTTYLSNNLGDAVHQFRSEVQERNKQATLLEDDDQVDDPYDRAALTFDQAERPVTRDGLTVEWSVPVLPDDKLWANQYVRAEIDRVDVDDSRLLVSKIFTTNKKTRGHSSLAASVSIPDPEDPEGSFVWARQYDLTITSQPGGAGDRLALFVDQDQATYIVENTTRRVGLEHPKPADQADRIEDDEKLGYVWSGKTAVTYEDTLGFKPEHRNARRRKLRTVAIDISDDENEEDDEDAVADDDAVHNDAPDDDDDEDDDHINQDEHNNATANGVTTTDPNVPSLFEDDDDDL